MRQLSLYLLGPYHVILDGAPVTEFRSDKVRALLAYLAVEADRPHRRDALAGLLWPDVPDRTARKNLRLTLHRLRDALDDLETESAYFRITRETIQVRPAAIWVDAVAFAGLIAACQNHDHRHVETCAACAERLAEAAALYRGDFLQGFFLDDCLAFSEWVLLKREALHRQALPALSHLAEYHRRRGEMKQAQVYATRQLELEPWREEAHRQLMDILARSGEVCAALAQFETCRRVLAVELDIEPDDETVRLYQRIRATRGRPHHNLPPQVTPFVGRDDELARIAELLADPDCRLLTIVGPGGIGKSRLAVQAAQMLADEHARRFLEGVAYVPLAGVESPAVLPSAIAEALG
ncbi:MAG: SARP family transcriptional regulator, partial [Chloroflexi bacterium]